MARLFNLNARINEDYVDYVRNVNTSQLLVNVGSVVILAGALLTLIDVLHCRCTVLVLLYLFFMIIPQFNASSSTTRRSLTCFPLCKRRGYQGPLRGRSRARNSIAHDVTLRRRVELRDVSFRMPLTVSRVEHVNLTVDAGKMTAVVGTSGAGKSTLRRLIMGLIEPQKGAVLIDGVPLEAEQLDAWRGCIGYVAQETFLFNDTVRGEPALGVSRRNRR